MIIEAKGTKQDNRHEDPTLRFVFKSMDKRSKTPYAIAILLLAFMVYLRAFLTTQTYVEEEKPKRPLDDPEGELPKRELEFELLAAEDEERQVTQSIDVTEGERIVEETQTTRSGPFGAINLDERSFSLKDFLEGVAQGDFVKPLRAANDNGFFSFDAPRSLARSGEAVDIDNPGVATGSAPSAGAVPPAAPVVVDFTPPGTGNTGTGNTGGNGGNGDSGENDDDDDDDDDTTAQNRAPTVRGPVYLMDVTGCMAVMIGLSALLRGAIDPDGDVLSVIGVTTSSGTLTPTGAGWSFDAAPQMLGPVTISYFITDGQHQVQQTAHFSVVRSRIDGTAGDDNLLGTLCDDDIDAGEGCDNIDALSGDDVIKGGGGDDHIVAGAGDDTVWGGRGNDIVFAGAGNDVVWGGDGDDRIYGEDGDDVLFGEAGDDQISGGDGNDIIDGGDGDDQLFGDAGNDVIDGGDGADLVKGGDGDDTLAGGAGNDTVKGGAGNDKIADGAGEDTNLGGEGNDTIVAARDRADDIHDGGDGSDTLDLSLTKSGVDVDLVSGTAEGCEIGTDAITGFETVIGGAGDDTIREGAGRNTVMAGAGDDDVRAVADGADDHFDGGDGCDTIDYSATSDGVVFDLVAATASGAEIGVDTLVNFETYVGGDGDDHFFLGGVQFARLAGGEGADTFEFAGAPTAAASDHVTYEILDFRVGDKVRMRQYELFEEVLDEFEDEFERIYSDGIDEDDIAIRYRHEKFEEYERTLIEADFNNDDIYETTITLQGRHLVVMIETA